MLRVGAPPKKALEILEDTLAQKYEDNEALAELDVEIEKRSRTEK